MNIVKLNKKINFTEYYNLINQLSPINFKLFEKNIKDFIDKLDKNINIFLLINNNKIIGSGTVIIENKIIHNFKKVGHIEDVIIDKNSRGNGYGEKLVKYLIDFSEKLNCYKIILNCSEKNMKFYEKIGFKKKNLEMSLYK
jgi:glucosamine-phosphate N-acetyltransferase